MLDDGIVNARQPALLAFEHRVYQVGQFFIKHVLRGHVIKQPFCRKVDRKIGPHFGITVVFVEMYSLDI